MRTLFILVSLVLLTCVGLACTEPQLTPTPTSTSVPELTKAPGPLPTPTTTSTMTTATVTPAPTATNTPTITPTVGPVEINYEISEGVPSEDLEVIQTGIGYARSYIHDHLGGDITSDFQEGSITVKFVTGGTRGNCCVASSEGIIFDVDHIVWAEPERWLVPGNRVTTKIARMKMAAHEYAHLWQHSLGCLRAPPSWIVEGMAEYIGWQTLVNAGVIDDDTVTGFNRYGAINDPRDVSVTLESMETFIPGAYNLPYFAIRQLVIQAEDGPAALRTFCEVSGSGQWRGTFHSAFGIDVDEFYEQFEGQRRRGL